MNRKNFFRHCFLFSCFGFMKGKSVQAASEDETAPSPDSDPQASFRHEWLKSLLNHMDHSLPDTTRIRLMESCGRDCAKHGPVKMAEKYKGNPDQFISALRSHIGEDNLTRNGDIVSLKYPECYCPMVSKINGEISDTWCECSSGWVLEMFETVSGKKVEMRRIRSILSGDDFCEFEIRM